ncbi:MAG TPA: ABC transporter ATP-binding protein [Actinomycetota bacterium]|nr:ABC transporter ATP-binding protein [Actinomycetota bacterium]
MALLEVRNLSKHFGGLAAVDDVDIHADEGEIVSVIGPNGAGKTTLFNIVTGFYAHEVGEVRFDGHNIAGLKPNQITKLGIARTFQAVRLFPAMTVLENAMVGQHSRSRAGIFGAVLRLPRTAAEERRIEEAAREALGFFGDNLLRRADELASGLAYADRRRLEIARAMATQPQLLLLDEPTAGMNAREKEEIIDLVSRLRQERGYTVVLIEHDMPVVRGVSDRVVALDFGRKIAEGTYEEVSRNERVIEAYLGKEHEKTA